MDTQISKGNLNELKGEVKKMWGKLTDDDMTSFEGGADQIIGKVQKAYGYTKDRAQQEFDSFKRSHSNLFRDERGNDNQENRMASTNQFNSQIDPNKIKNRAQHMLEEDVMEPAQEYLSKAREFGSKAMDRGTEIVKENPGYTVIGAAAVGFLLGAYVARRR
jgi:uncharacterized protein YjbJ (UPF0337 family)